MKTAVNAVLERLKNDAHPMFEGVSAIEVNGRYGVFLETPLHVFAVQGDLEGCKLLLEAGAEVDLPGEQGYTALHEAVHQGHSELVKLLLAYGSDPRHTTELGTTDFLAEDYPDIVAILKNYEDTLRCSDPGHVSQIKMSSPYFLVHSLEMKDDIALVDGRLGEVTLKMGHVFSRYYPSEDAWQKREDGLPCSLAVQGIEAYQHQLGELSPGMTARLSLAGSLFFALKSAAVIE